MDRHFAKVRLTTLICAFIWHAVGSRADESAATVAHGSSQSVLPDADELSNGQPSWIDDDVPIRRFRKQAVQKASVSGGALRAIGSNDLSTSHVKASISLGVPLGSFDNILGVQPSFRVDWIDSALITDVPSELFQGGVQFFWRKPITDRWSVMTIARPAVRSDFTTTDNAFRVFALGLFNWSYIPDELSLSFGAVYLDRADIPLLPAIGLMWTPDSRTRLDLRFPQSRFSKRLAKDGANSETWAYLAGGLGGNTWAVTRDDGRADEVSLRDFRLTVGLEHVIDGGGGCFLEAGYAFGRRLEYESTETKIDLNDGFIVRGGWTF